MYNKIEMIDSIVIDERLDIASFMLRFKKCAKFENEIRDAFYGIFHSLTEDLAYHTSHVTLVKRNMDLIVHYVITDVSDLDIRFSDLKGDNFIEFLEDVIFFEYDVKINRVEK